MLAYCSPASMKNVVIAVDDKFREPVVMFSNSVHDVMALDRATLGVCDYVAPPHTLQVRGNEAATRLVWMHQPSCQLIEWFGRRRAMQSSALEACHGLLCTSKC